MQSSKFYTFYDFTNHNGYPPFKPLIQIRLKKRMEWLINLYPNWDRGIWVNYFMKIIKDNSQSEFEKCFAHWHLLAYLDLDRCYLIWREFRKFPFYLVNSNELYDLSNNLLFQREKFQKYIYKYNSENLSGANLKTYILAILKNTIREKLDLKSSWRVLCDVDINSTTKFERALQKRKEALERYQVTEPDISQYIFALKYFIPVYKTNRIYNSNRKEGRRWPEPEWSDFVEVAKYYNSQRFLANAPLQASAGSEVTPETIKRWINICIKALQYAPRVVETSYNANSYEQQNNESINSWKLDDFEEEKADIVHQVDFILREKIQKIEHSFKEIRSKIPQQFRLAVMPLCYSHRFAPLNQQKLGNKIGVHQVTVSRYISKYFEIPLLNEFKQFTHEKLNLDSYLTIFLETRFTNPKFSNLLDKILVEAIASLDDESQKIIKFRYSQNMDVANIARALSSQKQSKPSEINSILVRAQNNLQKQFLEELSKWQAQYIKLWLQKYYQKMIKAVLLNSFKKLDSFMQEILRMRYCQKMDERKIMSFYPKINTTQAMRQAKQQLQQSILYWSDNTLGVSLATENQKVMEIIEDWLSKNLIYIEL